jgi:hypothetical protein
MVQSKDNPEIFQDSSDTSVRRKEQENSRNGSKEDGQTTGPIEPQQGGEAEWTIVSKQRKNKSKSKSGSESSATSRPTNETVRGNRQGQVTLGGNLRESLHAFSPV